MGRHADSLLAGCRINDEQGFLWLQKFLQVFEFPYQRFIDFLAACCVEDVNARSASFDSAQETLWSRPAKCCRRGALNIFLARIRSSDRHVNLFAERYELLDGRRPLQIARDKHRSIILFL